MSRFMAPGLIIVGLVLITLSQMGLFE